MLCKNCLDILCVLWICNALQILQNVDGFCNAFHFFVKYCVFLQRVSTFSKSSCIFVVYFIFLDYDRAQGIYESPRQMEG